jgi:hypothetical protein
MWVGCEPQRAVTNARRLVEQEKVFALFNTLGTPSNLAIWDDLNQQKVPQLYVKAEKPKAKVAVLFQNDGFGKDLLGGFEKAIEGSNTGSRCTSNNVSMTYFEDPEDPQWADDAAMQKYKAGMIEALKAMKEPTRDALMEAVRNMDVEIPMLLPGVKVTTSGNDDGYPIQATQIMKFNGESWECRAT